MTEDPQYNPAWPIYMALDFGWWTNFIVWVQQSGNGDLVINALQRLSGDAHH